MLVGPLFLENGELLFRVWAPKAKNLSLIYFDGKNEKILPMQRVEDGYYELKTTLKEHTDYYYLIDNEKKRGDPASRYQPEGVHGPSRVINPDRFEWQDHSWKGLDLKDYTIYELHVGTFTPLGTFDALSAKIAHLKTLGVTAIEIMPMSEFPGDRNWGYDGVYPFAPHHSYGGPLGLKRLIDAIHNAGLAVILDVVYNHLGPSGNYFGDFGPYFTDRYKTPWGDALNFDGEYSDNVRDFFIENALYWLNEFHVDAIRLDAVHALFDFSAKHFLEEIVDRFHEAAKKLGKKAYLIAESDLNDTRIINPKRQGGYAIDAQWMDDFHHSLNTFFTQSKRGYFLDFGKLSQFAKSLKEGFVYEGQWSKFRKKKFGNSSHLKSGEQFVIFNQNHDQVGNACLGCRLSTLLSEEKLKMNSTLLFCAPYLPLLFMGQEFNSHSPFYYFTSFDDASLAKSVHEGYCKDHQIAIEKQDEMDPQNPNRFLESKIDWRELDSVEGQSMFYFYQKLIQLRKQYSALSNCRKDLVKVDFSDSESFLLLFRGDPSGLNALILANFSDTDLSKEIHFFKGTWVLVHASSVTRENTPKELHFEEDRTHEILVARWQVLVYCQNL